MQVWLRSKLDPSTFDGVDQVQQQLEKSES